MLAEAQRDLDLPHLRATLPRKAYARLKRLAPTKQIMATIAVVTVLPLMAGSSSAKKVEGDKRLGKDARWLAEYGSVIALPTLGIRLSEVDIARITTVSSVITVLVSGLALFSDGYNAQIIG